MVGGPMSIGPANRRKWNCICAVIVVIFALLLYRLFEIQIVGHSDSIDERSRQTSSFKETSISRGMILDRRGDLFAISREVDSLYATPSEIEDVRATVDFLARTLAMKVTDLEKKLSAAADIGKKPSADDGVKRRFVWIKRRLSNAESRALRQHPMPGLSLKKEFRRFYPNGDLAAHLLGITDVDDRGIEGIERKMDDVLRESRSIVPVTVDGLRRPVLPGDGCETVPLKSQGNNVHLTIDLRIQRIVEEAVDRGMSEWKPKSISAIVMDPRTGEILALTNRPDYDPRDAGRAAPDARRNRSITDPFEPGSTLKPVIVAAALEERLCSPETKVDCENGEWKIGGRRLHDHHPYGILPIKEVISKSSNIGAAKIGYEILGRERMIRYVDLFGFGARTGIELPNEDAGSVKKPGAWTYYTTTSVPMGHEILVTPLQLVRAFAVFANGGHLVRPYIVDRTTDERGNVLSENGPAVVRRVIGGETARKIREMLVDVVETGTATKAKIDGLTYGGKTGTTKKYDPATRSYTSEHHISTFVAFAPAEDARLCLAVVVDEPRGSYYGGTVAAPIVAEIVRKSLTLTN